MARRPADWRTPKYAGESTTSHAYYNQQNHGPYDLVDIGALPLISGEVLQDCQLAVATFGQPYAAKDNAILIPTWYSGTIWIIADVSIGAGRAINPHKYVVNQIGNSLSSSQHNTQGLQAHRRFPKITIADDVSAQQAYEWAVRYPWMVERLAAIAGTARTSPINQLIIDAIVHGLRADPHFNGATMPIPPMPAKDWNSMRG